MDLTKREYTMHDHNTLLKEFILSNEGKLKKLQDDAKIAQVNLSDPGCQEEAIGSLKATWGTGPGFGEIAPCLVRVDFLGTSDYYG